MHPWTVVVAEPLQVLLRVCSQDRALKLSVYCGIAEERKREQILTMKVAEGSWRRCQFGSKTLSVVQNLGRGIQMLGRDETEVSPRVFLLNVEASAAEEFDLNNPSFNHLSGCLCCYS